MWKGSAVGYASLHNWVSRQLGKAKTCENCSTEDAKRYEWANISHEYKRDISDWRSMCKSCHERYDRKFGRGSAAERFGKW